MKSYNDKIATYGVLVAVIAIVVSLTTPEIRIWMGLEKPQTEPAKSNTETNPEDRKVQLFDKEAGKGKLPPAVVEEKIRFAKIAGCVFDTKNNPLQGVKVSIHSLKDEVKTDVNGFFEFSIPSNQQKGEYTITFSKKGYIPITLTYFEIPKTDIKEYLKFTKQ